jgi:hypothetical protein
MTAALSLAVRRQDLFNEQDRAELKHFLRECQRICEQYISKTNPGGWKMAGNMVGEVADCYSATLALLALLQMERSGCAFGDDPTRCQRLLSETAAWLVSAYQPDLPVAGWQNNPGNIGREGLDGMTIQIYSMLLEAEARGAVKLPQSMIDNIVRHIESCITRDLKYPIAAAEFEFAVRVGDKVTDGNEGISFLWLPWAIEASQRLLERHRRAPLPPEHLTRIRRVRAHLIDLAGEEESLADQRMFAIGELLCALGGVP